MQAAQVRLSGCVKPHLDAFGAKPLLSLICKKHIAKFGVGILTAFVPVLQEALRV